MAIGLTLTSPAFESGQRIPKAHACGGADVSPALRWTGAPSGTKSFALIMDDPDAPAGVWVHWVLYDLPASASGLPEDVPKGPKALDGARQGVCWGVERFDRVGYYGPCPPPGAPHRYYFKLYALDNILGLKPGATKAQLLKAMRGHVLAQAELMGLYQR